MSENVIFNKGILLCILYSLGSIASSFTLKIITKLFLFNFPTIVNNNEII